MRWFCNWKMTVAGLRWHSKVWNGLEDDKFNILLLTCKFLGS
jgi:hypothetical protein